MTPSDIAYTPILPEGWTRPRGFSHAVVATGTKSVRIAGQIGREPGQGSQVKLVNQLPWASDDKCNDPCPATGAQCSTATDVLPNCFHGSNTTNLHFHGLHVSPQAPQAVYTF
jgi:hypothetical protein